MVFLSWFDRQKPNLFAISEAGVHFILKTDAFELNENDVLETEDGYKISVKIKKDDIFEFLFEDALDFAKCAYEIGNRHQSICIEHMKITILNDSSTLDIVERFRKNTNVKIRKNVGYFKSNTHSKHSH
jgi:urease accessory protein